MNHPFTPVARIKPVKVGERQWELAWTEAKPLPKIMPQRAKPDPFAELVMQIRIANYTAEAERKARAFPWMQEVTLDWQERVRYGIRGTR